MSGWHSEWIRTRPSPLRAGVAACLVAALGVAPSMGISVGLDAEVAEGSSRWTKPELLLTAKRRADRVTVGAGPVRYAVVAWISGEPDAGPKPAAATAALPRVFASVRVSEGWRFGRPRALSPAGARTLQLGVAPNGETVLLWTESDGPGSVRVRARFRSQFQDWSEPQTVGTGRGGALLSVAPDGGAVATWQLGTSFEEGRAQAAVRTPGAPFGEPQDLPIHPAAGVFGPYPAAGRGGGALAVWAGICPLSDPQAREDAHATALGEGSTWSEWERIPDSKCPNRDLSAALGDDGGSVVIVNGYLASSLLRASMRPAGGSFGPAEPISLPGQGDAGRLGIDGSGGAIVTSSITQGGAPRGIRALTRPQGGTFGQPRRISSPRAGGIHQLAVSESGHAVSVWQMLYSRPGWNLVGAFKRPDGWFGPPERISPAMPREVLALPDVAVSPDGAALVAWARPNRTTATGWGVYVAKRATNCRGVEATLVGKPDEIVVSGRPGRRDVIVARGRAYRIRARGGNNLICAGRGADRIATGRGNSRVYAGGGSDVIRVGRGNNRVVAGPGNDRVVARRRGRNRIFARKGRNVIRCGPGRDRVVTNRISKVGRACDRVIRR